MQTNLRFQFSVAWVSVAATVLTKQKCEEVYINLHFRRWELSLVQLRHITSMRGLEHAWFDLTLCSVDLGSQGSTNIDWKNLSLNSWILSRFHFNHVIFMGTRWGFCSLNCSVGSAMRVSIMPTVGVPLACQ